MKFTSCNYGRLFQYLATLSGTFSVVASGIHLGWTSPYLPQILDGNITYISATSNEGSWCAVMPLIGAPFGAFLTALIVDRIGRKFSVLLWTPFMIASFISIALAKTILTVSIARFIGGSVEGALYTALPMYIAEVSDAEVRGKLSAITSIAAKIGTLFINVIGPWTSIFTSSIVCISIPLIHFIIFVFMPESPYYYIKKQKFSEAERSLRLLRGKSDVKIELDELCAAVKRQEGNERGKLTDLFSVAGNRRAAFIYIILAMTNKFSGKNPFLFYTSTIFAAAEINISPNLAVIIYCALEIVATLFALVLIDKFGRRPLLIFSTAGCAVSLAFEGSYFFLQQYYPLYIKDLGWWPILALISYNIIFSLGLAFGPVLLLGELFPTNIKGLALCSGDTFSMIMGTIASKFFQITKDEVGMFLPFLSFSACCFFFIPLVVKFLPETRNKTLEDIQMYLINKK